MDADNVNVIIPKSEYDKMCAKCTDYDKLKKMYTNVLVKNTEYMNMVIRLKDKIKIYEESLADAASFSSKEWCLLHNGANRGCGDLAAAMMLADTIKGKSKEEILSTKYPCGKNISRFYQQSSYYNAIRMHDISDVNRVRVMLHDYPQAFDGLDSEVVIVWCEQRVRKA